MGLALGEETTYSKLNKLLAKGELKPFVEAHSEFACQRVGSKMLITWAADAAPSSASAIVADSHSDGSWEEVQTNSAASAIVADSHSDGTWEEVGDFEDVGFDCFAQGFQ